MWFLTSFRQPFPKRLREKGFEPSKALSYTALNRTRLTTAALPHIIENNLRLIINFSPSDN